MDDPLYLDTARLGRMTPGARRTDRAFVDFAGDEGGSPYFERFLRHGLAACPSALADRHADLAGWTGVAGLKRQLRTLAGGRPDLPVLLASRSAQLMKLAARLLFHPCRNVLTTDLGWPAYHAVLDAERRRANRTVTTVPLRDAVLRGGMTAGEAVDGLCRQFLRAGCDGLFLPAVSNLGVRLPVAAIARRLEAAGAVRCVVVDGAQDFCHTPADPDADYCDLYLAGCHKWLGAYHPVGLGFYGRRRSRRQIDAVVAAMTAAGELDDPLLGFTAQVEGDALTGLGETVGLAGLLSCHGAAEDRLAGRNAATAGLADLGPVADAVRAAGWRPLLPASAFRGNILLAEPAVAPGCDADGVRTRLRDRGVVATAYDTGQVRLSVPSSGLAPAGLDRLTIALATAA